MRKILLTCFALMFSLMTASAQGANLPRCEAEQLSKVHELGDEIRALEDDMAVAETMSEILRLNADHLLLRQKLWEDIQLCDMNLEFISLFSARFNDIFAASSIEGISPGQEGGLRWKLVEGMAGEATNLLLSNLGKYFLSGLVPGGGDSPGEPLAACTETQLQHARGAKLSGYIEILNQALAVDVVDDLLRYDAAHLAFRESAWADLPRCVEAYEVAILMFRISGDFVVGHALAFLGIPRDSNPYVAQLMDDVAGLPAWMIPAALRQPDAVYALFETSLPECTAAELAWAASLRHPLLGPDGELGESFLDGINRSDLNVQAVVEIAWRDKQLAQAPRCTESLQIFLAMSQIGNDMVAAAGFILAGEQELASRYREQALQGAERTQLLQADIAEAKEPKGEFVIEQTELPGCTADQLAVLSENTVTPWIDVANALRNAEAPSDFKPYAEAQSQWRKDLLQRLPACTLALEVSLHLHLGTGNFTGLYAIDYAGVAQENNAYVQANEDFSADACAAGIADAGNNLGGGIGRPGEGAADQRRNRDPEDGAP